MTTLNDTNGWDNNGDAAHVPESTWTRPQLVRLENEWQRLQRTFAYHPHVRITPLANDPPDQYQVEYRVRTVAVDENGQLQYASSSAVHIWLPPGFPHEPPLVRPMSNQFHPNIANDAIGIQRAWTSAVSTLVQVVKYVGEMLSYQNYDPEAVYNPAAMDWMTANSQVLPTDPDANLEAEAGGEPLARIMRFGPRTLEQIRSQLKQICDQLLAPEGAPAASDTRSFARKTRQILTIFLESDIPDDLRAPASELDDFARELYDSVPTWQTLRVYRSSADFVLGVAQQLLDTESALKHEMRAIESLGSQDFSDNPAQCLRQLPAASRMQLHQGNITNLITRAEQLLQDARAAALKITGLPALDASPFSSALARRIEAEIRRASEMVERAQGRINAAAARLLPIRGLAKLYAQAVQRVAEWREYAELFDRGNELSSKIMEAGAGGLQAFYIENDAGRFGPFELEQNLTVGAWSVAVRNPLSTIIEVIMTETAVLVGRAETGTVSIAIPDTESGRTFNTAFQLTGNCEEMAVQIDYVIRQSSLMLQTVNSPLRTPDSWLGRVIASLARDASRQQIQAEHELRQRHWKALRDDLRSLRPFKERLATFRMLQRQRDAVQKLALRMTAAKTDLAESTAILGRIVGECTTDLETGQLHIPARHATRYAEQLRRRDHAKAQIAEVTRLLQTAIADIQARVQHPELLGSADRPHLVALVGFSQAWDDLADQIGDWSIAQRLTELHEPLQTHLLPEGFPPPEAHAPDVQEEPQPEAPPPDTVEMAPTTPPPAEPQADPAQAHADEAEPQEHPDHDHVGFSFDDKK